MKKIIFLPLFFCLTAAALGQNLPITVLESSCKEGKARVMFANVSNAKIDSVQFHFEGPAALTARKPLSPGGLAIVSDNCGCKGGYFGLIVYPGALAIGRDEMK